MGKKFGKAIRNFIPLAVLITGVAGMIQLTVQQNYRQNANDPQIQMAEDAAIALNNGSKASDLLGKNKIDMSKSLSPFLIVFDQHGGVIDSNAILGGTVPTPPQGVFDFVRSGGQQSFGSTRKQIEDSFDEMQGEDRFTWEPSGNARIAAVILKYNNGFVLAGRNLREVEVRENSLSKLILMGWASTIVATFISILIFV